MSGCGKSDIIGSRIIRLFGCYYANQAGKMDR